MPKDSKMQPWKLIEIHLKAINANLETIVHDWPQADAIIKMWRKIRDFDVSYAAKFESGAWCGGIVESGDDTQLLAIVQNKLTQGMEDENLSEEERDELEDFVRSHDVGIMVPITRYQN